MPRVIVLLAACALPACTQTDAHRQVRDYIAAQSKKSHVCEIHRIAMQPAMVPVFFGYPMASKEYIAASDRFPHATPQYNAGCVVDPKLLKTKVPVDVCPECKRAERHWALTHRKVPEAREILANRDSVQPLAWTY